MEEKPKPKFSQQVPLAESIKLTAFKDDSICSGNSPSVTQNQTDIFPDESYD